MKQYFSFLFISFISDGTVNAHAGTNFIIIIFSSVFRSLCKFHNPQLWMRQKSNEKNSRSLDLNMFLIHLKRVISTANCDMHDGTGNYDFAFYNWLTIVWSVGIGGVAYHPIGSTRHIWKNLLNGRERNSDYLCRLFKYEWLLIYWINENGSHAY